MKNVEHLYIGVANLEIVEFYQKCSKISHFSWCTVILISKLI